MPSWATYDARGDAAIRERIDTLIKRLAASVQEEITHLLHGDVGHIICPLCGGMDEAKVQKVAEVVPLLPAYGRTKNNVTEVRVMVPVWTCLLCEQSWTNWVAAEVVDHAITEVLEDDGPTDKAHGP